MEKYSRMLITTKGQLFISFLFFKFSRAIFPLRILEEYLGIFEAWKLAKENIFTDIYILHRFKSRENLIKWFDLQLLIFKWHPCSKSVLFSLYKNCITADIYLLKVNNRNTFKETLLKYVQS